MQAHNGRIPPLHVLGNSTSSYKISSSARAKPKCICSDTSQSPHKFPLHIYRFSNKIPGALIFDFVSCQQNCVTGQNTELQDKNPNMLWDTPLIYPLFSFAGSEFCSCSSSLSISNPFANKCDLNSTSSSCTASCPRGGRQNTAKHPAKIPKELEM